MLREKVRQNIKASRKRSAAQYLPQSVRQRIRALSGGDQYVWSFLRGLLWQNRVFLGIAILLNVFTALFEISTLGVFYLAIDLVTGGLTDSASIDSTGFLIQFQNQIVNQFGTEVAFLIFVFTAVALQILRSSAQFGSRVTFAYVRGWIEGDLRRKLLNQITDIDYADISKQKVGELSIYADHINNVGQLISHFSGLLTQGIIALSYTGFLVWLSWQLSIVAVLMLVLISIGLRLIRKRILKASDQYLEAAVSFSGNIVEFIRGLRIVHLFDRKKYAVDMMKPIIDQTVQKKRAQMIWSGSTTPIIEASSAIGVAIFLLVGYRLYTIQGAAILASLTTFVVVLYRLLPRASAVNNLLNHIRRELPFATRLADMLNRINKKYLKDGTLSYGGLNQAITFEDVSLNYSDSDLPALKQLSFSVEKGQTTAFVGPSGAGKSSVINLIVRLYDPTNGQILVDGTPLSQFKIGEWRGRVGVVDQDTFIFNSSILENIRLGRLDATSDEVMAAAKAANAHEFILNAADGYDTVVGNRGFRLSGGQVQRIAIARAILRDPEILILDEATSALDSKSEELIQLALDSMQEDRTVIIIAHRLSTIATADKIVVLENGEIVESGSHSDLIKQDKLYADLWKRQSSQIQDI